MNIVREIAGRFLLVVAGTGLAITLTAWVLCAWNCLVSNRISAICAAWRRSSFLLRIVTVSFVGVWVAYASVKPQGQPEGRYLCLVSSLPNGQVQDEGATDGEEDPIASWPQAMRHQLVAVEDDVLPPYTNEVNDLRITGFSLGETSVLARVDWSPANYVPQGELLLFAYGALDDDRKQLVGKAVGEEDALRHTCEVPYDDFAAWTERQGFAEVYTSVDVDEDGIPDAVERWCAGTDPCNPDTDGDGIPDGDEVAYGFNPLVQDAGRDMDGDGMPDIDELMAGLTPGTADTDGDGLSDGVEWMLGLDPSVPASAEGGLSYSALLGMNLGLEPADSQDPVVGDDNWPALLSSDGDYEVVGDYEVSVTFDGATEDPGESVLGVSWPGGSALASSVEYEYGDHDTNGAFSVSAVGPRFLALVPGWYLFQVAADDSATLTLGDSFSVSGEWSGQNPSGAGVSGAVLMAAGEELPIGVVARNEGGPGRLSFPVFGRRVAIDQPSVNVRFAARSIAYDDCEHENRRKEPDLRTLTACCIEVYGGDFGGTLTVSQQGFEHLEFLGLDGCPTGAVSVDPGERKVFVCLYRGISPSATENDVRITSVFEENRTGRELEQTATMTVRRPEITELKVVAIRFNHDFHSTQYDGVNIQKGYRRFIRAGVGEWRNDGEGNDPACYVAGRRGIMIKAKFDLGVCVDTNLTIAVESADFLCESEDLQDVSFCRGKSDYVTFTIHGAVPSAVGIGNGTLTWTVVGPGITKTSGPHKYYVILDEPKPPWSNDYAKSQQMVWADALDIACTAAAGETEMPNALAKVTRHLFRGMGFVYDSEESRSRLGSINSSRFRFSSYIRGNQIVNCFDQARGVLLFGAALGVGAHPWYVEPFGYIRPTALVGHGNDVNNPLYLNPTYCGRKKCVDPCHVRSWFDCHAFVMFGGKVYDACVGPALGTQEKYEYLVDAIDDSDPYWGASYFNRIINDGEKRNEFTIE